LSKLKQLFLCDESETKNDDDDKHEDPKVRDTKATGKSTEQACNVSNPTRLVTSSSVLNEILTYPKLDQQKKETKEGYKVQSQCKSSTSWERRKKQRGKRKESVRKSDKRKGKKQLSKKRGRKPLHSPSPSPPPSLSDTDDNVSDMTCLACDTNRALDWVACDLCTT